MGNSAFTLNYMILPLTVETSNANMVANNSYATNSGSQVVMTLPTTAALGTILTVVGMGSGGWQIAQNASQNIKVANNVTASTTTGTGGSLTAVEQYASIQLLCTVANTTWTVIGGSGSYTIV